MPSKLIPVTTPFVLFTTLCTMGVHMDVELETQSVALMVWTAIYMRVSHVIRPVPISTNNFDLQYNYHAHGSWGNVSPPPDSNDLPGTDTD